MSLGSNEAVESMELDSNDFEFVCPKCNKEVIPEENAMDDSTTDGQASEWDAGFRLCPECGWYGQVMDEEVFEHETFQNEKVIKKYRKNKTYTDEAEQKKRIDFLKRVNKIRDRSKKYNKNDFENTTWYEDPYHFVYVRKSRNRYDEGSPTKKQMENTGRKVIGIQKNGNLFYLESHDLGMPKQMDCYGDPDKFRGFPSEAICFSKNENPLTVYLAGKVNGTKQDVVKKIKNVNFVCSDGNNHSEHDWGWGQWPLDTQSDIQTEIKDRCISLLKECDFLVAWIDKYNSYGSIAEISYASAIGKKCFVFYDKKSINEVKDYESYNDSFQDTYWFVSNFPNVESMVINREEAEELIKVICDRNNPEFRRQFINGFSSNIVYRELREKEKEEFTKALSELKDLEKEDYEDLIKKEPMSKVIRYFKRDQKVVKELKKLYNGKCQVKDCGYTFKKKSGDNYCETHHINPLNNKGSDDAKNMVCLCPNHHKVLHFGTDEEKKKIKFEYDKKHYKLLEGTD